MVRGWKALCVCVCVRAGVSMFACGGLFLSVFVCACVGEILALAQYNG